MTIEGARLRIRNAYVKKTAKKRRSKIIIDRFTIISNNCWGGTVYESYNLEKMSPTVGMYFAPEEYLKFVSNLPYYINECKMELIEPEDAIHKELYKQDDTFGQYPIARVGDVEIALLHYHSKEEALAKWARRCQRVCWDRLIVKMNDQNGCSIQNMQDFLSMPINCRKKLFFTAKKAWKKAEPEVVYVPQIRSAHVFASLEPFGASRRCNINRIINSL